MDPVQIESITLCRAEGPIEEPLYQPFRCSSFREANTLLRSWARTAPDAGAYDKTDCTLVWRDGRTEDIRYDLVRDDVVVADVARAIRDMATFYAGDRRPPHMSAQEYSRFLDHLGVAGQQWARELVDHYEMPIRPRIAVAAAPRHVTPDLEKALGRLLAGAEDPAILHESNPAVAQAARNLGVPALDIGSSARRGLAPEQRLILLADQLLVQPSLRAPGLREERLVRLAADAQIPVSWARSPRERSDLEVPRSVGILFRPEVRQPAFLQSISVYVQRLPRGTAVLHPGEGPVGRLISRLGCERGLLDTPIRSGAAQIEIASRAQSLVIFPDESMPPRTFERATEIANERRIPVVHARAGGLDTAPAIPSNLLRPPAGLQHTDPGYVRARS